MSETSRSARFVQDTVCTALYQITAMVMGFITPRIMILYYGSAVNGLIVSATEFLTYFKMVESGLAAAAVVALYQPLAKRDYAAVSGVVSAARGFYHSAGWLFCGATVALAVVYPFIVPVETVDGGLMSYLSELGLIVAMGLSGALEFFTLARYRVLLTADRRTYIVSLASMASLMLSTAVLVMLPYIGTDVIVVRLAASCTIVLRSVLLRRYSQKHYPEVDVRAKPNKAALGRRGDALCVELTQAFQQGAGVILATLIVRDAGLLSVYGVYHMATVGLWGVLKMATTGVYSQFGHLLVSGDTARFRRAYRDFESLYQLACVVLFSAAAVLIVPFVNLYTHDVTDANYHMPLLGLLVIAEAVTNLCKTPLDVMVSASGRFGEVRTHCFIQVGVTVAAGVLLGLWGLQSSAELALCGVAAGVCVGNLVRTGLQLHFVPISITGTSAKRSLWGILRAYAAIALIAAPFLLWVHQPQRFFSWAMYGVMLVLYASAVAFALSWLFDCDAMRSLIRRVARLLRHKGDE